MAERDGGDQPARNDGIWMEKLLLAVKEVRPLFDQLALTPGKNDLDTLRRATAMLPIEMETAIVRMVDGHLSNQAERDSFSRRFPNVDSALSAVEKDLVVSLEEKRLRQPSERPHADTANHAQVDTPKVTNYEKIDRVILWVLTEHDGPMLHKEIATAFAESWTWYCRPVVQKTVLNHFSGSAFLKEHTDPVPGGRRANERGFVWVKRNPTPQRDD